MSVIVQGNQLRGVLFGTTVRKAATTPPNSGSTATLFTVVGGAVLVTGLVGIVTTALSGSTGAISLGTAPTVGTAQVAGLATATVVGGAEAGAIMTPLAASGLGGALAVQATPAKAGASVFLGNAFVVPAGTITWTTSVATMTGQVKWVLTYVPLDDGASVS